MEHQKEALKYCKLRNHIALFMELRLGKTLVLIRWVQQLPGIKTCLVVAPLTVLEAWKTELTFEGEPYLDLHGLKSEDREEVLVEEALKSNHRIWVLINYDIMLRIPDLAFIPWDIATLDESTKIKNPQSQITKICTNGFRRAKHRAILSGLPAPESPLELFCQFKYLTGRFMGHSNFWGFKEEFFEPGKFNKFIFEPKKGVRAQIKDYLHGQAFILRRKQVNLGSKKIFQQRHVDMTAKQKSIYNQIIKDSAYIKSDGSWNETQWAMTGNLWFQRLAGGFDPEGAEVLSTAKAQEVLNILEELQGDQAVVWFKFRAELELVKTFLKKEGISFGAIDGDVKKPDRELAIGNFRKKKIRVLLATEKCAKMGIDCSTADCAIYYSNEWSCEDRLQSEDRILHPMKKDPLLIIDLVTRDTVDVDVVAGVREKSFNSRELLIKHVKGILDERKSTGSFRASSKRN